MDPFARKDIVVRLANGPCGGKHAVVKSFGEDCWQKLDRVSGVWCRYLKNLFAPGEYVWSGEAVTENELKAKLTADTQNTYGASEAA